MKMGRKAICIKNIKDHPVIGPPLDIGKVYITYKLKQKAIDFKEKYMDLVHVYKGNTEMGVYPKSNFKFVKKFRQERVNELID